MKRSTAPLVIAALVAMASVSGCVVATEPVEEPLVVAYTPLYYRGYVVYYDDGGWPYYYDDGAVVYVPRSYVHYDVLVAHYRGHRRAYHEWHDHHPVRRPHEGAHPHVHR
jgi:hypothetical protein